MRQIMFIIEMMSLQDNWVIGAKIIVELNYCKIKDKTSESRYYYIAMTPEILNPLPF